MKKIGNRKSEIGNLRAFTLIELLVVIAIIGILAAMLMPALTGAIQSAQKGKAKTEMASLVAAIQSYYQDYGQFPVSPSAQNAALIRAGDFTYGSYGITNNPLPFSNQKVENISGYNANNSEVIAILMDITNTTVNANHQKNPKQVKYLTAKMVSSASLPGVCTTDYVYRDPWGNPYVISMDLNYNGMCVDAFYCINAVSSGGLNGLVQDSSQQSPNNWALTGTVMVWSAGPDGQVNSSKLANTDVNKDNVLSWQ